MHSSGIQWSGRPYGPAPLWKINVNVFTAANELVRK